MSAIREKEFDTSPQPSPRSRRRGSAILDRLQRRIVNSGFERMVTTAAWTAFAAATFLLATVPLPAANAPAELRIDFSRTNGLLRPLHGLNKGPLAAGGMIDVTAALQSLKPSSVRLHDCHWPNPDVVDIHCVFPDFKVDPEQASSYDFALTDEYLSIARQTGAEIVYRLGESIEHTSKKRFVHPPPDAAKWADICLGIIRHYNEGWAKGFHHDIRYWEIWNEPENRPAMWSGTDEDYFRLYRVAASTIKKRFPNLKVGGPAVGASGQFVNGEFRPTAFVTNFLALCRRESLPLDFFSWHCYTANPSELVKRARAIRSLLDAHGFHTTESHLNEWNYLPGNSWKPLSRSSSPQARQDYYEEMAGASGAAFIVTALLELQDAPVDVCNLFHGELGGFGLFNEHGIPQKNYHALRAFCGLLDTPRRVEIHGAVAGKLSLGAGLNEAGSEASVLIGNLAHTQSEYRLIASKLPWTGRTIVETRLVDATHDFAVIGRTTNGTSSEVIPLTLKDPAVAWVRWQAASGTR
jgi:xylan 1,4-beta-xylosidase